MICQARNRITSAVAPLLALIVAGCQSTPEAAPTQTVNDPVRETVAVQELRSEVADLRDAIEVQRNELQKMRERQRQLYDDLDYRMRQAEQVARQRQAQPGDSGGGYSQTQQAYGQGQSAGQQGTGQGQQQSYGQQSGADEQVVDQDTGQDTGQTARQSDDQSSSQSQQTAYQQQSQGTSQVGSQGSSQSRQGTGQQMPVASSEEQSAYDSAFELLKQSRYNDAIIDFRSLITRFPNGALVDDAQYWIGEAYYVTRDFQNALGAFQAVVNQYPDSQRVPEAMLKLGYVQAELGQNEQARQTLNEVISQYPGSRVAISAETRLSRIQ